MFLVENLKKCCFAVLFLCKAFILFTLTLYSIFYFCCFFAVMVYKKIFYKMFFVLNNLLYLCIQMSQWKKYKRVTV